MTRRNRWIVSATVAAVVGAAGWYWWSSYRIGLYGGVKPYMRSLRERQENVRDVLARNSELTSDYVPMEQLAQSSQDIVAVFLKDERAKDPRFNALAVELMRNGARLEHTWDAGKPSEARAAFAALTQACNDCHAKLAEGKPPKLTSP